MAILKVKLLRNLRRSVLRGHPWLYKEALIPTAKVERASLCQLSDAKGDLAWGIYDPHGVLALRVLSLEKNPPGRGYFETKFNEAFELRSNVRSTETDGYRLFNGEGDWLPGLVCDIYGETAVVQFDGQGPSEFWDRALISSWLLSRAGVTCVVEKKRRGHDKTDQVGIEVLTQSPDSGAFKSEVMINENSALFKVNIEKGQKTGFFLDQRDNREFVREVSSGKSVLNLFSYTGGFSVNAGLGGAKKVASVDMSQGAIDLSEINWSLNKLDAGKHQGVCADVFKYLEQARDPWDHVIVDPPSMSHSEATREVAIAKYIAVFSAAAKRVGPRGSLSLSSCSSHVSYDDFFEIINETMSNVRRRGQILKVSGQGSDHPFPHACHELRYLKFVHLALD